jgi:hypothetical protein
MRRSEWYRCGQICIETVVVVTDLLDQQDKLVRRLLLVVEFKFCRGRGCSFDQLTEW